MSAENQWETVFETMMQQSPLAMLPLGHSLAKQGRTEVLTDWMKAIGAANWTGLMVDDTNNIGPVAFPTIEKGSSKPGSINLNPAAVLAIALNANSERVRTDAPLDDAEKELMNSYLQAAKGHKNERHLYAELLWAVCAFCDRGDPVRVAIDTGADPTLRILYNTHRDRGIYQLDTAFGLCLKGNDSARPHAFLALCETLGPPKFLDDNDEFGIDFSGLLSGVRGSSTYSPGPKIWQELLASEDPAPALAALLQIEQRAPSRDHDDHRSLQHGRATVVAHHVQHAASRGVQWNEEVVEFLLGRSTSFTGTSGMTIEQSKVVCDAIKIGSDGFANQGAQALAFQIQVGLAAHCKPLLEHCREFLPLLKEQPALLQNASPSLVSSAQRAKESDQHPMPLSFVIKGLGEKQVLVESHLADVLQMLELHGLLAKERLGDRRTAMHFLATEPAEKKADWFFRLVGLGLDPEGRDAAGNKPLALIKDKDEKAAWQGFIRLIRAREAARDAVNEMSLKP